MSSINRFNKKKDSGDMVMQWIAAGNKVKHEVPRKKPEPKMVEIVIDNLPKHLRHILDK
jgi:hypothetical protein